VEPGTDWRLMIPSAALPSRRCEVCAGRSLVPEGGTLYKRKGQVQVSCFSSLSSFLDQQLTSAEGRMASTRPQHGFARTAKCCAGISHFNAAMGKRGLPMTCYGVPYTKVLQQTAGSSASGSASSASTFTWTCAGWSEHEEAGELPHCIGFEALAAPENELHPEHRQQPHRHPGPESEQNLQGNAVVHTKNASSDADGLEEDSSFSAAFQRSAKRITDRMSRHISYMFR